MVASYQLYIVLLYIVTLHNIITEVVTIIVASHQLHSDDTDGEHTHNRFKWAPSDGVS